MSQPKPHKYRAMVAANFAHGVYRGLTADPSGCIPVVASGIARETFPSDLVAAARACERYLVKRGIESRGEVGRFQILPALRAALTLYPEPATEQEQEAPE